MDTFYEIVAVKRNAVIQLGSVKMLSIYKDNSIIIYSTPN